MDKQVKIGVLASNGYFWNVLVLDVAHKEAMKFLDSDQYSYAAGLVRLLASEQDPTHSVLCSVDAIEDFNELRAKHGPLGNINLRVFFFLHKPQSAIVVLGAVKKQNNGATPLGVKVKMRRRKRLYIEGEFGQAPVGGANATDSEHSV